MEKITIRIFPGTRKKIDLVDFPHLSAANKTVKRGIDLLHRHAPKITHFLSRQRAFSRLQECLIEVLAPAGMDEASVVSLLQKWINHKKTRRLFYIIVEVALLPFAILAGALPGPNILFYSLFILFYFHVKAFFSLGKIKVKKLDIDITYE